MNIPYELAGNGTQVMVPQENVLRLRMSMAEEGLPAGGSIGYEIFDRTEAFGPTTFVQNINRVRALEGELSRTIRTLKQVREARVHLVLPQREVFTRETSEATASVVLPIRGAGGLDDQQIAAIQHLLAAAVPDLHPSRVSVIDDQGNLLASGTGEDDTAGGSSQALTDYRARYEAGLKLAIERLLESTIGLGRVRAEVTADLDLEQVVTNAEEFDPDGQVVRSTQTVAETEQNSDTEGEQPVTVAENLPEADVAQPAGARSSSAIDRSEETVNYEISKTVRSLTRAPGAFKRLSVAVLVDGTYTTAEDGTKAYTPRSAEDLERYATLVRTAIGFDEGRGDQVGVANIQFAQIELPPKVPEAEALLGLEKADYLALAEIIGFVVVGALIVLLVLRPLVGRVLPGGHPA